MSSRSLMDGEDPATTDPRDARHWIAIYDQLIEFKERLLGRVESEIHGLPTAGQADVAADLGLVTDQLHRYQARRESWVARHSDLERLVIDEGAREVIHRDQTIALTEREFQLLRLLLTRPHETFTSRQLVRQAWGAPGLSGEELRIYIARLRKKLAETDLGTIVNQPGKGYAMRYRSG